MSISRGPKSALASLTVLAVAGLVSACTSGGAPAAARGQRFGGVGRCCLVPRHRRTGRLRRRVGRHRARAVQAELAVLRQQPGRARVHLDPGAAELRRPRRPEDHHRAVHGSGHRPGGPAAGGHAGQPGRPGRARPVAGRVRSPGESAPRCARTTTSSASTRAASAALVAGAQLRPGLLLRGAAGLHPGQRGRRAGADRPGQGATRPGASSATAGSCPTRRRRTRPGTWTGSASSSGSGR